ncbi:MAG: succinate dehydrogenase [Pseudomonadota bacterium]
MKYVTDRKRALGMGSGREGTHHHWQMMVSSIAVVVIVPVFVITFMLGYGEGYIDVVTYFSRPVPALITAFSLVILIRHMMFEALEAVEDYIHGTSGKLTQVAVTGLGYGLIATGLFALAKLAF